MLVCLRGNNAPGWQGHVIFSMLLERRAIISRTHLKLFLPSRICQDFTVCVWFTNLTLLFFPFATPRNRQPLTDDTAHAARAVQFYTKGAPFIAGSVLNRSIRYQTSKK